MFKILIHFVQTDVLWIFTPGNLVINCFKKNPVRCERENHKEISSQQFFMNSLNISNLKKMLTTVVHATFVKLIGFWIYCIVKTIQFNSLQTIVTASLTQLIEILLFESFKLRSLIFCHALSASVKMYRGYDCCKGSPKHLIIQTFHFICMCRYKNELKMLILSYFCKKFTWEDNKSWLQNRKFSKLVCQNFFVGKRNSEIFTQESPRKKQTSQAGTSFKSNLLMVKFCFYGHFEKSSLHKSSEVEEEHFKSYMCTQHCVSPFDICDRSLPKVKLRIVKWLELSAWNQFCLQNIRSATWQQRYGENFIDNVYSFRALSHRRKSGSSSPTINALRNWQYFTAKNHINIGQHNNWAFLKHRMRKRMTQLAPK